MIYYIKFPVRAVITRDQGASACEQEHMRRRRLCVMKHIKTLTTRNLKESMKKGGCGECQTSCQSACKTSCTVGNQSCEKAK